MTRRKAVWVGASCFVLSLAAAAVFGVWSAAFDRDAPRLRGAIVYASDRSGGDQLYWRSLATRAERRLTWEAEPARDPTCSPDGTQVAFSTGGRIGLVSLKTGKTRLLTLGVDWRDAEPAFRPDGQALIVAARKAPGEPADIHELVLDADPSSPTGVLRRPLTDTPGLDEQSPIFSADGRFIIYVREEALFRLDLAEQRSRRLTSGFRKCRSPRFLPDGRLVYAWSEAKRHGIDRMDSDGKNHVSLTDGTIYYRTVAPAPDGRHLAATFAYDLSFHVKDALRPTKAEEIRLLGDDAQPAGVLVGSWLHAQHSPCWVPAGS